MKNWVAPEVVARFDKNELTIDCSLGDHTAHNESYNETYNQTYTQSN